MLTGFAELEPRERSGTRSANRFDYQLSWAFCLMLDLNRDSKSFLLVLDHHDDVVVFDSESSPEAADFYQIKTETRKIWTITKLLERSQGTLSILGKLYGHKVNFGSGVKSLNFVSNQLFSLRKSGDKKESHQENIKLSELCSSVISSVSQKIKEEYGLEDLPEAAFDCAFKMDSLPPKEHSNCALGKFTSYLSEVYGDKPYAVSHAFNAILDLMRRRNNHEGTISTIDDVINRKSLKGSDFSKFLQEAARIGDESGWDLMKSVLVESGTSLWRINEFKTLLRAREIELLDVSNIALQASQSSIENLVSNFWKEHPDSSVEDVVRESSIFFIQSLSYVSAPCTDQQIRGGILVAIKKLSQ